MGLIVYSETSASDYQSILGKSQKRDYTLAKRKLHIALLYYTGKKYVPPLRLVSFLNSHDVPTEKVTGASQVTSTVTEGNKIKRVAHYIHMEFAYSKICFILFSRVLFIRFFPVIHSLITLSTVENKVSISESFSLIDKSR
jgi:hypothetical protein